MQYKAVFQHAHPACCHHVLVVVAQVSALEELLAFLSSLPAFGNLSRELLTSLAVFSKPVTAHPGQVLAVAGQPADTLIIIQVGGTHPVGLPYCMIVLAHVPYLSKKNVRLLAVGHEQRLPASDITCHYIQCQSGWVVREAMPGAVTHACLCTAMHEHTGGRGQAAGPGVHPRGPCWRPSRAQWWQQPQHILNWRCFTTRVATSHRHIHTAGQVPREAAQHQP